MSIDKTSNTMLDGMGSGDDAAWEKFYHMYWQPIVRYGMKLGLKEDEAHDVLQVTMMDLMRIMPGFAYDSRRGKFRNFVFTIVHRKVVKLRQKQFRYPLVSMHGTQSASGMAPIQIAVDPDSSYSEEDQRKWRMAILESCLDELRKTSKIEEVSFEVFIAFAMDGKPAKDVADQFKTNENNVYQIKSRICGILTKMVADRLDGYDAGDLLC